MYTDSWYGILQYEMITSTIIDIKWNNHFVNNHAWPTENGLQKMLCEKRICLSGLFADLDKR